jgi:hypothetical protein
MSKKLVFFARPADRSLKAFKEWIRGMAKSLGCDDDDMTEEECVQAWREFWKE